MAYDTTPSAFAPPPQIGGFASSSALSGKTAFQPEALPLEQQLPKTKNLPVTDFPHDREMREMIEGQFGENNEFKPSASLAFDATLEAELLADGF